MEILGEKNETGSSKTTVVLKIDIVRLTGLVFAGAVVLGLWYQSWPLATNIVLGWSIVTFIFVGGLLLASWLILSLSRREIPSCWKRNWLALSCLLAGATILKFISYSDGVDGRFGFVLAIVLLAVFCTSKRWVDGGEDEPPAEE